MSTSTIFGNMRIVPLSVTIDHILYDKNPYSHGLADMSKSAEQILFANHVDVFYELILAMATFDAQLMKANPHRRPVGLNILQLGHAAQCFFESHPDYRRPPDETVTLDPQFVFDIDQFRKSLRGRTEEICQQRMAWMRKDYPHVNFDATGPHQWRETDDPIVISSCFHRLLITSEAGMKPDKTACLEALQAALKLYGQPHRRRVDLSIEPGEFKHCFMIDRSTALGLAIEVGDLETATDILELAIETEDLPIRGLSQFLQIPSIFDVLPIYAKRGPESNRFHITENEARNIVAQFKGAMESRIANGQQRFLEGISWTDLFDRLKVAAWKVYSKSYRKQGLTSEDDVLFPPATEEEIAAAEEAVGSLPDDFKGMIRVANGFRGGWHFLEGGMAGIQNISIMNPNADTSDEGSANGKRKRGSSSHADNNILWIQPGSHCDAFIHNLIPPQSWKRSARRRKAVPGQYLYAVKAHWRESNTVRNSVREWVSDRVREVEEYVSTGYDVEDL